MNKQVLRILEIYIYIYIPVYMKSKLGVAYDDNTTKKLRNLYNVTLLRITT